MSRAALKFIVKALVSLGLIVFLLSRIDLAEFLRVLGSARPSYLLVALGIYVVGQLFGSIRWALLAWPLGFKNSIKEFVTYYFIGMFFNLFTPSTVGGDLSRVYYLSQGATADNGRGWTGSTGYAIASVVTDRAIGMAVLVWIGAAAVLLFPGYALPLAVRYAVYGLALVILIGALLLPRAARFLQQANYSWGRKLALVAENYRGNWWLLAQTIVLSLFAHSIQVWMQLLVGQSLDVELPWSYCFILYPLVGTFSALPLSLNGIGLREGGYLFLLRHINVDSEKAVAFGLLWLVIVALDSLIGGILFVLRRSGTL
jgi:glycosyltransferase 2 family protein